MDQSNIIIKDEKSKNYINKYAKKNIKISKITPKSFLKDYIYENINEKYCKKSKKKIKQD